MPKSVTSRPGFVAPTHKISAKWAFEGIDLPACPPVPGCCGDVSARPGFVAPAPRVAAGWAVAQAAL